MTEYFDLEEEHRPKRPKPRARFYEPQDNFEELNRLDSLTDKDDEEDII